MVINFSGLDRHRTLGRILRAPLRLVPPDATVPILQGPIRGMKWTVGSATHGCWLGSYELGKRRRLQGLIRPGYVVYDIGANVGYYTLLSSVLVGPTGRVFAFEPLPSNLDHLHRHIRLNRLANCTVLSVAVGRHSGRARFQVAESASMGSLAPEGGLQVDVRRLDDLYAQGEIPGPNLIKMDIEGGELAALEGAEHLLTAHRPLISLSTHGTEVHAACCRLLVRLGYSLESLDQRSIERTDDLLASPG